MREACTIEVCTHTAVERRVRERQRMRLCCVKNVAAQRRHRVRASAVGADELQVGQAQQ